MRTVAGLLIAGLISFFARRGGILSFSGAITAVVIGTICAAAGWDWAGLLAFFFATANLLSRYRQSIRSERIDAIVEKGNKRDAWQVAANGGVFAAAAVAWIIHPSPVLLGAGAGAIAAVTADTWSTEIGTVAAQPPRLITTWQRVPPGTSGGVTWLGSFAALAGALAIAGVAFVAGWGGRAAAGAIIGGVAGSLADSLAGATVQRRQWCARCGKSTERLVHNCGTITTADGGIRWIGNDVVNALSAVAGAIAGSILSW